MATTPNAGRVFDRGSRGFVQDGKSTVYRNAWTEPQGAAVAFEDFIASPVAAGSGAMNIGQARILQSGTPTTVSALSATAGPVPVGHGGWVAGSVDNVDDEIDEVFLSTAPWMNLTQSTNQMTVAEIGFVIPTALTARMYFFGLGDAAGGGANDDGMLSIVSGTTLVSGATGDAAGFVFSSLATDVNGFYMGAVKATSVGTAVLTSTGSLETVAVDNYLKLRVEADSDGDVWYYGVEDTETTALNRRKEVVFCGTQSAAVTANVLYLPIFSAASTTTTAVEWEIDYIFGATPGYA